MKSSIVVLALIVAPAASAFAQAQTPPKPQTPPSTAPAQPPAAAQPAAPKPQPPVPFPADAKYAVVDVQVIAQNSAAGKDASKKLNDLQTKNNAAIQEQAKQLQALQAKQQSAGVLNDAARAQLDKDVEKLQRDIQYAQSNNQAEMQQLNNELQADFTKRVAPVIEEIAKEKGLYLVFTADSGFAYVNPGLNITDEVIKRLDTKQNAAVKKNE